MTNLVLCLESPARCQRVERVASFVAEDASGSFGIEPGHEPLVTVLDFGLSRFRGESASWQYLAAPGAVLFLDGKELHFATRRYVLGDDFATIQATLREQIRAEERDLQAIKNSLRDLEQEMLRRLSQLGRRGEAP
jgi:F-type H+-transporting ATPase subunit epsilon